MKHTVLIVCILMMTGAALADVPPEQKTEVAHLLQFVKNSSCTVNRNGTIHQGDEAASHILKKYKYFQDKIESTEQFIEYSASKSSLSGKYYTALCDDAKPIKTRDWLLLELAAYRKKRDSDAVQQAPEIPESKRGQE